MQTVKFRGDSTGAVSLVVPVIMQFLFQQSKSYMTVKLPVRVLTFPVCNREPVFTVQTVRFRVSLVQFVLLVDVAVFMQRHVGALVLRAVEVPQTQFIDRLVDMFSEAVPSAQMCWRRYGGDGGVW